MSEQTESAAPLSAPANEEISAGRALVEAAGATVCFEKVGEAAGRLI